MTLAQVKALLVGQTVLYTPVGEIYGQIATVIQNGPDINTAKLKSPSWLRIRIHDPGTGGGGDWHLDYPVSGAIPTLSLPTF
jgi:hypothetical protein